MSKHDIDFDFATTIPDPASELETLRKQMLNEMFRTRTESFARGFLMAAIPFAAMGWFAAMLFKELTK